MLFARIFRNIDAFFVVESFLKQVASVMGNTLKNLIRDPIVPHLPVRMLMISGRGSKPLLRHS